jgi:hypothetical protein
LCIAGLRPQDAEKDKLSEISVLEIIGTNLMNLRFAAGFFEGKRRRKQQKANLKKN